jgi:assimilatory nitrate reductase catalytic subunit
MPEKPDAAYPFLLLTGRGTSSQWHTNTRTGKSEILRHLYPAKPYAEINPGDALTLGLRTGDPLQLTSRRGSFSATALVTAAVQPGHVFVPMHYAGINDLTFPAYDPLSRQPSYKHCAVRVQPLTPPPSPTTR